MIKFLIDEDLPKSFTSSLKAEGISADDIREIGLRGLSDSDIYDNALKHGYTVVTGDRGFGNIYRSGFNKHHGLIIINYPNNFSNQIINNTSIRIIKNLHENDIIIIEPGKIRLKKNI